MDEVKRVGFGEVFYSRQVAMKELGIEGQQKLAKSCVAVVGVGGLGTVSSLYLALSGVGHIRLIDKDVVELHNLHRQILYSPEDIHCSKVDVAAKRLRKANPLIKVEAISEEVHSDNIEQLLLGVDCVVDGLDNMPTRYIVNRTCVKNSIPYVFGAASGMEGNLSVFTPPTTGCLECAMPNHQSTADDNKQIQTHNTTRGVIGATPGIIGSLQAIETIKLLTNTATTLKNKLLICDFNDLDFTTINLTKNTQCPTCHNKSTKK
ncbi:MAG: HesA/MoeB/ThiF family protein [Candidatus Bathyarchaeota archaeon]|nr:HesA/MoeB/ThiF family protein [Candidatus Termiticorpusculum sp.]